MGQAASLGVRAFPQAHIAVADHDLIDLVEERLAEQRHARAWDDHGFDILLAKPAQL